MVEVMKRHINLFLFFIIAIAVIPFTALLRTGASPEASLPAAAGTSSSSEEPGAAPIEDEITVYLSDQKKTQTLSMKDYLVGVVTAEMPATFEKEALKAQAVLAHTYTLRVMANEEKSPSDDLKGASISTDPSRHQAYCSEEEAKKKYGDHYEEYHSKIESCVNEVMNQILTYEDEPIIAAFHAISAGNTEAAENVWGQEVPYLVPAESEGDLLSPSYEESLTLTTAEVKKLLTEKYEDLTFTDQEKEWFQITDITPSGYVATVTVLGKEMTGQDFRTLFGLRSSDFSISFKDDKFTFTTKGYGHGVGMSQYGADYMARQGSTYQEILAHYYPKTTLSDLSA